MKHATINGINACGMSRVHIHAAVKAECISCPLSPHFHIVVEKVNFLVAASQHGGTSVAEGSP